MARLQSVAVGGFIQEHGAKKPVVDDLPVTPSRNSPWDGKGNTAFSNTTSKSHLNDEQMRDFLEWSFRPYLDPECSRRFVGQGSEPPDISGYDHWQRSTKHGPRIGRDVALCCRQSRDY
ncbi:hypothetical protein GJ744_001892 [Endocarpon pusillum]|uniref:Uncharacterized protein n=1 Tax=Endocarpon pusillum TaxID=364733 RepID=A0A8H7AQ81_9EURO|nr:hypothetical protein GJ744_001892 [Endocarpon pusillum]